MLKITRREGELAKAVYNPPPGEQEQTFPGHISGRYRQGAGPHTGRFTEVGRRIGWD